MIKVVDSFKKFYFLLFVFLGGEFYLGWVAWEVGRNSGSRLEGIGPSGADAANFAAASMVVAIPILFSYVISKKNIFKLPYIIISAFVLNGLVLINSRGSFVGLIGAMLFLIVKTMSNFGISNKKKIIIIAMTFLGIAGSFYLMDDVFISRFSTLSDTSTEGSGARMLIWSKGFDVVKDYPFGVGRRGFSFLSPEYVASDMLAETGERAIHNTYLQALTDMGYVGGGLFLIFVLSNLRYAEKHIAKLRKLKLQDELFLFIALESSFVAYLTTVVFINGLYMEMIYFTSAFIIIFGRLCSEKIEALLLK